MNLHNITVQAFENTLLFEDYSSIENWKRLYEQYLSKSGLGAFSVSKGLEEIHSLMNNNGIKKAEDPHIKSIRVLGAQGFIYLVNSLITAGYNIDRDKTDIAVLCSMIKQYLKTI